MSEILSLFTTTGTASALVFLSLVGIAGVLLGKIKIFNIKMGIAGVLFSGLLAGHLGAELDPHLLHFVKEFGLILFVYSIGLEVGPRFMSSIKNQGLTANLLAASIVFLGFGIALFLHFAFDVPIQVIVGIMCGAVTNTPSLGAAQQVITEQMAGVDPHMIGMGYAVAYPFGIFGIIITILLIRFIFKVKVDDEIQRYRDETSQSVGKIKAVKVKVTNQNLFNKPLAFINSIVDKELAISRIKRKDDFIAPTDDVIILEGDELYGACDLDHVSNLELQVGSVIQREKIEVSGPLGIKHVMVTNKKIAGKTIEEIGVYKRYPVNITRIFRAGTEHLASKEDTIEFGDTVRIVGQREALSDVAKELGNSVKDLSHPNIIPILIGIFVGIIIGSIPIALPGLPAPAKLGLAGGPLLIALLLGHKGKIGKLDFYMTPSSNLFIRELGIILFLSCVGLSSGKYFVETLINGGYMWMLYGAAITFFPLIIVGIAARMMKMNYLSISGLLAGSMTDPPALEFANSLAPVQAQSTAYATVYPLVMFLRVLMAQVLVLLLL